METENNHRLYRSPNRMIAGVCAGIAEFFGLNVTSVRLATLLLLLFGGLSLWVYIMLWLIVPRAPKKTNV